MIARVILIRQGRRRLPAVAALAAIPVLALAGVALAGGGLITQTKTVSAPSGGAKVSATAKCPKHKRVVLSGFRSTVGIPQGTLIAGLDRSSSAATATARDFGDAGSLTSIAYCGEGPATSRVAETASVPAHSLGSAIATCPSATTVRGGGFSGGSSAAADTVRLYGLLRISSRKWRATVVNASGLAQKIKAIAYCGVGPKLTTAGKVFSFSDTASGNRQLSADCPGSKELVMGGFAIDDTAGGTFVKGLERKSSRSWKASFFHFPGDTAKIGNYAYCA